MAGVLGATWRKTPTAIQSPAIADLYWAAGFMDGEACFNNNRIKVAQKDRESLDRLKHWFGGNISQGNGKANPDIFVWSVSGARARGVMLTLFSMLSQRRRLQIRKAVC